MNTIPTWADHARELGRVVVSRVRSIAQLCATIREPAHHSKPRSTP